MVLVMQQLWAPWRMAYIDQATDKAADEGCIFCSKPQRDPAEDEAQLIVYRGARAFVMMNLYPYNTGHLLIAPYNHTGSLAALDEDTSHELFKLVQRCETACREALNPDGFNIGANLGRVAGAGFPDHVHFHVVPRWNGDTNFMPVIGDVKVMPEFLQQTYEKIRSKLLPLIP
jgi:ATP adenylyltransferase